MKKQDGFGMVYDETDRHWHVTGRVILEAHGHRVSADVRLQCREPADASGHLQDLYRSYEAGVAYGKAGSDFSDEDFLKELEGMGDDAEIQPAKTRPSKKGRS